MFYSNEYMATLDIFIEHGKYVTPAKFAFDVFKQSTIWLELYMRWGYRQTESAAWNFWVPGSTATTRNFCTSYYHFTLRVSTLASQSGRAGFKFIHTYRDFSIYSFGCHVCKTAVFKGAQMAYILVTKCF